MKTNTKQQDPRPAAKNNAVELLASPNPLTPNEKPRPKRPRKTPPHRNGWTPARREAQAARIRASKPWLKSTGPRTESGKARAARNAYKHGWRSEDIREVRRLLRAQREFVRALLAQTLAAKHLDRTPAPR